MHIATFYRSSYFRDDCNSNAAFQKIWKAKEAEPLKGSASFELGADGGTWTLTPLRALAPEASASAIPPHLRDKWCEWRDLNPYVVWHTPLKRACLPVPAHSRFSILYVASSATICIIHVLIPNVNHEFHLFSNFLGKFFVHFFS